MNTNHLSVFQSDNDVSLTHKPGQVAAVRWLDGEGTPRWYVVVILAQWENGYYVLWQQERYIVDFSKDETLFCYTNQAKDYFIQYPDAISVTVGKDVYLLSNPDVTFDQALSAINFFREKKNKPSIRFRTEGQQGTLRTIAMLVPNNKIIFE